MPELPEVQTVVTDLSKKITGKTIRTAEVLWPRTVSKPAASDFASDLQGSRVEKVSRRGKFIVVTLLKDGKVSYWLTHLRMTGQFSLRPASKASGSRKPVLNSIQDAILSVAKDLHHLRVRLTFTDGSTLLFTDPRKFARMYLVSAPAEVTGGLGPEPLEIRAADFIARLKASKKTLKPLLMDQSFLAGVGNIYADESLHYALLHPLTPAHRISEEKAKFLHAGIQKVLKKGIRRNGASIDRFYKRINGQSGSFQEEFMVYGRRGLPCLRCSTPIRKTTVAQRGTHFCPSCQRPPRKSFP